MEEGLFKGEVCNREGCKGIIDAYEKEGSCSCHIHPPCSYCETNTEYCPVCGWDAQDERSEYELSLSEYYKKNPPVIPVYKSDDQLFDELKDGEFGYIRVASGGHSIVRIKGKHPDMSSGEIYKSIGVSDNPNMPRMVRFTHKEFELTYFCD